MNSLVTGATGVVGANLVRELLSREGHVRAELGERVDGARIPGQLARGLTIRSEHLDAMAVDEERARRGQEPEALGQDAHDGVGDAVIVVDHDTGDRVYLSK